MFSFDRINLGLRVAVYAFVFSTASESSRTTSVFDQDDSIEAKIAAIEEHMNDHRTVAGNSLAIGHCPVNDLTVSEARFETEAEPLEFSREDRDEVMVHEDDTAVDSKPIFDFDDSLQAKIQKQLPIPNRVLVFRPRISRQVPKREIRDCKLESLKGTKENILKELEEHLRLDRKWLTELLKKMDMIPIDDEAK